jgi:hypothetical protein
VESDILGVGGCLPDFGEVCQALAVVFEVDPVAHSEFAEERHHLAYGQTGHFGCFTEGGFAFFVFFDGEEDSVMAERNS